MKPLREYSTSNKLVSLFLFFWMLLPFFLFGYIVAKDSDRTSVSEIPYQEARISESRVIGFPSNTDGDFETGYDNGYDQGYDDGYCAGMAAAAVDSSESSQSSRTITAPTSSNTRSVSTVVYITETGKCYHSAGCGYLNSCIEIDLDKAKSQGYTPCSRCNPPR